MITSSPLRPLAQSAEAWAAYSLLPTLPPVVINDLSRPLLSIVTPSFNQGPYVRETIESVLNQDYPNIEYWLIDGGSSDATLSIVREYENDSRFHWLSEKDCGQADAINKGWSRCRGAILAWINSDDTYLPGAFCTQVQALQDHPDVGVVYGDVVYTDEQGHHQQLYRTRNFNRRRFLHVAAMGQPAVFLRRTLVEQYGPLDIHLHYALDFELFLRYLWSTEFLRVPQTIATSRLYASAKTMAGYGQSISESVAVARRECRAHRAELGDITHKVEADWYWAGANQSLLARNWPQVLAYSVVALRHYPFSPRMLMFGLKLIDALFHTSISTHMLKITRRLGI
jgi:glycosyltransferase involved in cell wall biosynthesis